MIQALEQKFYSICFISLICKKTHKDWYKKSLKVSLFLKYNDFDPYPRPKGPGQLFAVARPIHVNKIIRSMRMSLHSMGSTGSGTQISVFVYKKMHLKLILGHFSLLNV